MFVRVKIMANASVGRYKNRSEMRVLRWSDILYFFDDVKFGNL
jgi:hypothetical protein